MASEQFLLNDTSVASGAFFAAVTGGSYKLKNNEGVTLSRTTSSPTPYEGAGSYCSSTIGVYFLRLQTSASADITGSTKYFDTYHYIVGSAASTIFLAANDTAVEYSYVNMNGNGTIQLFTYDASFGETNRSQSAGSMVPSNAWFRLAVKTVSGGVTEVKLFKGATINGTTADDTRTWTPTYSAFEFLSGGAQGTSASAFLDDIKFDDAAYPTRSTAHTAAAAGTGTATGTAAMSNARTLQASATGTATGTAAASNQRTLAATATATASGVAAMSSTQAMSASATATATGTAAGSITALITIDGAGTATATGTAGASSTQLFAASATVTATGTADASIRPLATVDGVGTITATGTTTFNKSQTLAATATATATASASMLSVISVAAAGTATANATAAALITTPGSLYGNATKVAGLYGSSTKPTLTTRS